MSGKSALLIGISVAVLSGASAFAAYFIFNRDVQLINAPAPSDWHVYRNAVYGFELRYPPRWTIQESKGWGSPLNVVLQSDSQRSEISFTIHLPAEPVADKVAAWKTSDDFISAGFFETRHLRGRRVVWWDSFVARQQAAYFFNKPGTNVVFLAGRDRESEQTPELEQTFNAVLASFTFLR